LATHAKQDGYYLFANDANMGEATRSPTIKADDRTPSSKLLKWNSPLHTIRNWNKVKEI
jgi:hypothetical protein